MTESDEPKDWEEAWRGLARDYAKLQDRCARQRQYICELRVRFGIETPLFDPGDVATLATHVRDVERKAIEDLVGDLLGFHPLGPLVGLSD
jgi:hypothetical protein